MISASTPLTGTHSVAFFFPLEIITVNGNVKYSFVDDMYERIVRLKILTLDS